MKPIIFTNGKYYNPETKSTERLNFLIENGIIAGQGYMPEEDEAQSTIIDIPNHFIVPNIIMPELLLEFAEKNLPLADLIPIITQEIHQLNPQTIPPLHNRHHPKHNHPQPKPPRKPYHPRHHQRRTRIKQNISI
jgi:hypothetical protein